ncbi:hypothetical protein [Thermodesulfatator autotrophicus]|uniref:Uncharacterized protein n=1 Tax=Thermodesulfatator autotrophicus TaxID=1795632 RepID=A0A177E8B3_9BACT|nr:hypothetical protein [Thermodesulfatator autotrophicus]OAG27462.1 hypothetical protein TH606_06880 [Thermodesulfatator autotrophicus]
MKKISSPRAIKTCYIAQIKEEMGLKPKNRRAANRKGEHRRVKTPDYLKPILKEAFNILLAEKGTIPSYKEVQQKAFEILKKREEFNITEKYFAFLEISEDDKNFVEKIAESEEIFYEEV